MKKTIFFLALPLIAASCGPKNDPAHTDNSGHSEQPGQQPALIYGVYSDTLPCADCPGILTELAILPDTTYRLSERKLGADGRPANSSLDRGVYSFPSNGHLKLTSRKEGHPEKMFEIGEKQFKSTEALGSQASADLTLDLKEEVKGKKNGEYVYYKTTPFNGHPTMVYSYVKGNDIHIGKAYLDVAPESERAIVAYYASQFNTGCEGEACTLAEALGMDEASMKTVANKWMPAETLHPKRADAQLALLFIMQNGNQYQVNYNVMGQDNSMMSATDVFILKDNQFTVEHKAQTAQGSKENKPSVKSEKKPSGRSKG
ncbi:MAG: copper resistance protein NlpE [Flavobacteriales bacterium]|nr:copper resistance protein NlpE [Flavobacteriales bacterium]